MPPSPAIPLCFDPICQYRPWGGRRLADWLGGALPNDGPIGEAWLLSDREDNPSRVSSGPFAGQTLAELITAFPAAMMGDLAPRFARFPLLLKYLDVSTMLSVQVHPSDAQAALLKTGETGKTEGWVVLEAQPESLVYAGLNPGIGSDDLRALSSSSVDDLLPSFRPAAGQAIFVEAGEIHAFGNGMVVLEVQQNSDVTFRLYDWDRIDPATGEPRQLQVEKALQSIDFAQGRVGPVVPVLEASAPNRRERLFDCAYFQLWRTFAVEPHEIPRRNAPVLLVCVGGSGEIEHGGRDYPLRCGATMFLPAAAGRCRFRPDSTATLLEIVVPPMASPIVETQPRAAETRGRGPA